MADDNSREADRDLTRRRASRTHQGPGHWHVEKRSTVIICQNCQARIQKWKNPRYCPDCGEGKGS